jgi:hypothetical protein
MLFWFFSSLAVLVVSIFVLFATDMSDDPVSAESTIQAAFVGACAGAISLVICALVALARWIMV